ncbi:MAG: hypothetical protein AB7I19_03720 [Planctomycetota bacterium]
MRMDIVLEHSTATAPGGTDPDVRARSAWAELAETIAERCVRDAKERAAAERARFDLD